MPKQTMSNPAQAKKTIQPQPRNQHTFDPWNTSSTGHQRAENPYSRTTEWRDTRREKLARQFRSNQPSARGDVGGSYINRDEGNDGRGKEKGEWKWMSAQEATRNELGVADIRRYMGGVSKTQPQPQPSSKPESDQQRQPLTREKLAFEPAESTTTSPNLDPSRTSSDRREGKGIFTSLTFYINGSTYPTISDHKLKRLLADEGGNISLYLARKSVTHVILGAVAASNHAGSSTGSGGRKTGGLLSAGKMQKEVLSKTSGFGVGVKYVHVDWVIESIKAGRKLPEARFSPFLGLMSSSSSARGNGLDRHKTNSPGVGVGVPVGQKSVYDMFSKSTTTRTNEDIS